jgi:hypothetical protein
MARWIITITDHQVPALVGGGGNHYCSPPHTDEQAKALLRLLLDGGREPGDRGPWRCAIPGGQRQITLRRCP